MRLIRDSNGILLPRGYRRATAALSVRTLNGPRRRLLGRENRADCPARFLHVSRFRFHVSPPHRLLTLLYRPQPKERSPMADFVLAETNHHFVRQQAWEVAVLPF